MTKEKIKTINGSTLLELADQTRLCTLPLLGGQREQNTAKTA